MLPWQRKSILIMLRTLQLVAIALSIARNLRFVELDFQMGVRIDFSLEFHL